MNFKEKIILAILHKQSIQNNYVFNPIKTLTNT